MAAPQLRRNRAPSEAYGEPGGDFGKARLATDRFAPDRQRSQSYFAAPADPRAEARRAIAVLTSGALAGTGAIAGIAYFVGLIAAGIVAAAAVALIAFGNWILNHTIELR